MSSRIQSGNLPVEAARIPLSILERVLEVPEKCACRLRTLRREMGIFTEEEMGINTGEDLIKADHLAHGRTAEAVRG
jgi:hypothetical protein